MNCSRSRRIKRRRRQQRKIITMFMLIFLISFAAISMIVYAGSSCKTEENDQVYKHDIYDEVPVDNSELRPTESEPDPEPEEEQDLPPVIADCTLDWDTQVMIYEKCKEYKIDYAFIMALIFKESTFDSDVISTTNDYGLMQINKINHEWLSEELGITDFLDPEQNVTAGLYILHDLFEKYEDPELVLMAYNLGETGARNKWNQGIYTNGYAEGILQQSQIYQKEISERKVEK